MIDSHAKCISIYAGMIGEKVASCGMRQIFAYMAVFVTDMVRSVATVKNKTTRGLDATGCVRK